MPCRTVTSARLRSDRSGLSPLRNLQYGFLKLPMGSGPGQPSELRSAGEVTADLARGGTPLAQRRAAIDAPTAPAAPPAEKPAEYP